MQASPVATADTASGTVTPVWPQKTTKGSLLVLMIGSGDVSSGAHTTTPPTGWTLAVSQDAGSTLASKVYYKADAAVEEGSVAITVSALSATGWAAQLFEVSGILAASPLDKTASTGATSATPASGTTATLGQAIEFCIAGLADARLEAQTAPTSGWTQYSETQVDATADVTFGVYWRTTRATTAQSVSVTTATSDEWAGAIATFKGWHSGAPAAGQTTTAVYLAAQDETTAYDIFTIDESLTGTWTNEGSITVTDPTQFVSMAHGMGRTWLTSTQFGSLYMFDGLTVQAVSSGPAGKCVAVHKNRVFVGGPDGTPGFLHFSNLGDGTTFSIGDDLIVGTREDGETLQAITPFEDGLLCGKREGLWFLSGSGPSDFQLDRLNGGGCATGQSIAATPYGAVIAGTRHVWLWAGGSVERISGPIEASYYASGTFVTVRYARDENVYICDESDGTIYRRHMPTGAWSIEELDADGAPAAIFDSDNTFLYGPAGSTVASLLNYKVFPWSSATARDKDFDALTESFSATSDEIWVGGPRTSFTPLFLHLQIRQRGGDATDGPLTITPTYDGVAQTALTWTPQASAGTYRESLNVGSARGVFSVKFAFAQTLASGDAATLDIEDVELEGDLTERTP